MRSDKREQVREKSEGDKAKTTNIDATEIAAEQINDESVVSLSIDIVSWNFKTHMANSAPSRK